MFRVTPTGSQAEPGNEENEERGVLRGCANWDVSTGFSENDDSRICSAVDIGTIEVLSNCHRFAT
jgi:hypothetical protein